MGRNYFLTGAVIGLICAYLVGLQMMGPSLHELFRETSDYMGSVPILAGGLCVIFSAVYLDRRKMKKTFLKSGLLVPAGVFLLGSAAGSLVNFFVNGQMQDPFAWFVRPMFWLTLVGLPLALVIGSVYYGFNCARAQFQVD